LDEGITKKIRVLNYKMYHRDFVVALGVLSGLFETRAPNSPNLESKSLRIGNWFDFFVADDQIQVFVAVALKLVDVRGKLQDFGGDGCVLNLGAWCEIYFHPFLPASLMASECPFISISTVH
jgi:hypothetical protein